MRNVHLNGVWEAEDAAYERACKEREYELEQEAKEQSRWKEMDTLDRLMKGW